jgi:tRNA (uracil-5-)-methyltransferase TRM9
MATSSPQLQPAASDSRPNTTSENPESYEAANVHSIYSTIAPHFSATRHKPWPNIARFLRSLPPGSVGLDVGCGNGKYLPVNRDLHILASDRSPELLTLAKEPPVPIPEAGREDEKEAGKFTPAQLAVADTLNLPYRASAVDFIICIAVIHHLSTRERRIAAIAEMLRCLHPSSSGQCLIYAWALEQSATSRRAWNKDSKQDTLVPWVLRQKGVPQSEQTTYQRYYHLFREGELEEDVVSAGGKIVEKGYDQDNWWVICSKVG